MWLILASLSVLLVNAEILPGNPRIIRDVSDGVRSLGYEIVYGDEEMSIINEVVTDMEKENILKSKQRLTDSIKPLPAEDVKCLMSVDRYCSKEMGQMKSVLIRAVKDDCANCSNKEKDDAGKVIASMMAHDPSAWKMFLTRCAILRKKDDENKKSRKKREEPKYKLIGEPEEIDNSRNRKVMPGVKIKVKRYKTIRIN